MCCTNAAVHSLCAAAVPEPMNPMIRFPDCCPYTASGDATIAPPTSVMNSRRLMAWPAAEDYIGYEKNITILD